MNSRESVWNTYIYLYKYICIHILYVSRYPSNGYVDTENKNLMRLVHLVLKMQYTTNLNTGYTVLYFAQNKTDLLISY